MNILIIKQNIAGFNGTNAQLDNIKSELELLDNFTVSNHAKNKRYDLLILPTSEMHLIPSLYRFNRIKKTVIWCLGHGSFKGAWFNHSLSQAPFWWFSRKLARYLASKKLLVFSDVSSYILDLGCNLTTPLPNDLIVPISIKCSEKMVSKLGESFIWLGRLSYDFKFLSLKRCIIDLNKHAEKIGLIINLDIVGDGEAMNELIIFSKLNKGLNIKFLGSLDIKKVNTLFLSENYRMLLGMGTSVLEASKYGLPAVIIMPMRTTSDFRESHVYRRITETTGMSTGEFPNEISNESNVSFEKIMSRVSEKEYIKSNYDYSKQFCSKEVAIKIVYLGGFVSSFSLILFKLYAFFKGFKLILRLYIK
jgi:glycosyltransferase involved in cell wall biosynthesis